jgi:hypothetical protein
VELFSRAAFNHIPAEQQHVCHPCSPDEEYNAGWEDLNMASVPHSYTEMRNLKWSPAEKAIAHKAFDAALQQELESAIREAKERAAGIGQPSELWELERCLTERRQEIDRKYDFRYSVLPLVFARLIREGRLSEQELHGLAEDKLVLIRQFARP